MAKNTGKGHRVGAVGNRSEFKNSATGGYTTRDTTTGRFLNNSKNAHKGVRDEKCGRRVPAR